MRIDETRRGQPVKTVTTIHWSHSVIPAGQTGTVLYDLDTGLNQHLVVVRWQDGSTGLVFATDLEPLGGGAEPSGFITDELASWEWGGEIWTFFF